MTLGGLLYKLARKKVFTSDDDPTKLKRCLTTVDLVALAVGSTLGAGVYVLSGEVARSKTGPSIIISFLVAAFASVLAGLCYAEFGARVPKAGSAYVYSYVTVGELWAFVIGWNLILEYVISASSVARAWSSNIDALAGGTFKTFGMTYLKVDVPGVADYPDFIAFVIIMLMTVVLCYGVKESAWLSKLFTLVNVAVIGFVVVGGLFHVDIKNWNLTEEDFEKHINETCYTHMNVSGTLTSMLRTDSAEKEVCHKEFYGSGGFAPHGFTGIIKGAAVCFYGFVGFDVIASTGEEAMNPNKSVPLSICISLFLVFIAYFGISCILTLMRPYYLLDPSASLPNAFAAVGWTWAVYVLAIGATCALLASLMGSIFPLPRIVYAMAQDGLMFKKLATVNQRFQTPIIATLSSGLLAAIMALIFDLSALIDMMSIGTLLAYTLVAACVLILRYLPDNGQDKDDDRSMFDRFFSPLSCATKSSGNIVYRCTLCYGAMCFVLGSMLTKMSGTGAGRMIGIGICSFMLILLTFIIYRQPHNLTRYSFMVPFLPFLPIVSCFCNIYLMCELDSATWVRFMVWMLIGFAIYFGYGLKNSRVGATVPTELKEKIVTTESDESVVTKA